MSVHGACKGRSGTVYVDGVSSGDSSNENVLKREFANTPQLIAVQCQRDPSTTGLILASLSNGFISGDSWKCNKDSSSSVSNDWHRVDFDDSKWEPAVVISQGNTIDGVSDNAAPIWWRAPNNEDELMSYCRGTVGKHVVQTIELENTGMPASNLAR